MRIVLPIEVEWGGSRGGRHGWIVNCKGDMYFTRSSNDVSFFLIIHIFTFHILPSYCMPKPKPISAATMGPAVVAVTVMPITTSLPLAFN
jgi:hypothetical protein